MSRKPLQSYNSNVSVPRQPHNDLIDTPVTHASVKITTPPYLVYTKRNNQILETPVRPSESSSSTSKNILLSPAFSSPQAHTLSFESNEDLGKGSLLVPPPAPFSNPARSPFLTPPMPNFDSMLAASTEDMNKRKQAKPKKPRTNSADSSFCLDSDEKPPYSYATLIGMSILTHPDRQLTLSQIYQWISETFKYYRREDVGWQNLIRHNLSLNKAFVKGAKSKDGKGHFWCIKPECEDLFLKARNNKKSLYQEVMEQLAHSRRQSEMQIPLSPTSTSDNKKRPLSEADDEEHVQAKRPKPEPLAEPQEQQTKNTNSDSILKTPSRLPTVSDSPYRPVIAGKNMTFTSSFSCSLNFELSPAQPLETGPLLEPLTPTANNVLLQQCNSAGKGPLLLPSITLNRVVSHHLPQLQPSMTNNATPRAAGSARTPKSAVKTPVRTLKTPLGSTLMKKLWHSPSYLEEFYYSPFAGGKAILNSYDDDEMLMRAFDSPATTSREGRVNLFQELKCANKEGAEAPSSDATEVDGSEE